VINNSPVLQGIFPIARKNFFLFQMGGDTSMVINERSPEGPFNTGFELTGNVFLLMIDARCERKMFTHNLGTILSNETWRYLDNWLDTVERQSHPEQLFTVCTTPLVYPHSNIADRILDLTNNENLDDSRDHWPASIHRPELERLIDRLLSFSRTTGSHITTLTGDVHCGGYGEFVDQSSGKVVMQQFISSGVSASPPPPFALFMFKRLFQNSFTLRNNIKMSMKKLPNGELLLATQNFLCLNPKTTEQKVSGVHHEPHHHHRSHEQPTESERSLYTAVLIGVPKSKTTIVDPLPKPIVLTMEVV
jgi:hypothetical protein